MDSVRNALRSARIGYNDLKLGDHAITFRINNPDQIDRALLILQEVSPERVLLHIGSYGAATMRLSSAAYRTRDRQTIDQSMKIIRQRLNGMAVKGAMIQHQGMDRILVELPTVDNPERLRMLLVRTAKLTFQLVDTSVSLDRARHGHLPPVTKYCRLSRATEAELPLVSQLPMSCADVSSPAEIC